MEEENDEMPDANLHNGIRRLLVNRLVLRRRGAIHVPQALAEQIFQLANPGPLEDNAQLVASLRRNGMITRYGIVLTPDHQIVESWFQKSQ
jgi:hypothetical protein